MSLHREVAGVRADNTNEVKTCRVHWASQFWNAPVIGRPIRLCHWVGGLLRRYVLHRRRAREQAMHEKTQVRAAAMKKSRLLLLQLLSDEQRSEFEVFDHFHVTGGKSGDRYCISKGTAGNIALLDKYGRKKQRLCGFPAGDIPEYDVMAGQALYLQDPGSEAAFLSVVNRL